MHRTKNLYVAFLVLVTAPLSVQAAEWSAEPSVSLRTGYNDNIRLTAQKHDSVWEAELSPKVKFGVKTETSGLSGDAGFAVRRFYGGSGRESSSVLNREDYHFNTGAFHNTPRNSFKATIDYTRDSTLDSELDQTGNVIDDRATRERFSLGPSWTSTLTELTRLELTYRFTKIDYSDDPGIANLVSYKYHSANASLVRQLTPRVQGTIAAGYNSFRPTTDFNSETVSLQAGLTTSFTETLNATFLLGQRQTTSDSFFGTGFCIGALPGATFPSCTGGIAIPTGTANAEVETNSAVYTASISKKLETGSLSASLTRSSSPGGNGELLDTTRLVLFADYNFTETLSSSLKIEYTENETIVNRVGFVPSQDKETFFRVTPRAVWRWHREWELAGEYQHAENDDPLAIDTATRNAVYITLRYRPTKRSISR
jgi:hypothetical protein